MVKVPGNQDLRRHRCRSRSSYKHREFFGKETCHQLLQASLPEAELQDKLVHRMVRWKAYRASKGGAARAGGDAFALAFLF